MTIIIQDDKTRTEFYDVPKKVSKAILTLLHEYDYNSGEIDLTVYPSHCPECGQIRESYDEE